MDRGLREFRVRGVKTNIPFLENVVNHARFSGRQASPPAGWRRRRRCSGSCARHDRATKLLSYLARRDRERQPQRWRASPAPTRMRTAPCRAHDLSARPRRHAAASRATGPGGLRRMDAGAEAAAAHRHHVPRRAPIAAGHARAHLRHAGDRQLRLRTACTTSSAWRCGAARPST